MTTQPFTRLTVAIVGMGGVLVGGYVGIGGFVALFEILWWANLESPLDRPVAIFLVAAPFVLVGLAVGVRLAMRGRRPAPVPAWGGVRAEAMTIILAVLAGIAGGVVGYYVGEDAGFRIGRVLGSAGKDELILGFILGALVLMVAGIWLALRHRGHRSLGALGRGILVAFVTVPLLICANVITNRLQASHYTRGVEVVARFEIRLPAGAAAPAEKDVGIIVYTDRAPERGHLYDHSIRREGDQFVLVGFVWLNRPTDQRILALAVPGQPLRLFRLALAAKPTASDAFGPWQRVDLVEPAGELRRPAGDGADFDIRYRIER